jgi:hypothetical protein
MFGLDKVALIAGAISGAVLAGAVALPIGYFIGKHDGDQQAKVSRLEADVDAYVKREGIDHEVDGMERYRICLDLGGLPNDCEQLRGVEETTEGK